LNSHFHIILLVTFYVIGSDLLLNLLTITKKEPYMSEILGPRSEEAGMPEWQAEMERTVPAQQLDKAQRLARRFGHEWGDFKFHWNDEPIRLQDIRDDTVSRRYPGAIAGITHPELDDDGNIVHQTMTGRTRWKITPEGATTIVISRPDGDILAYREEGHASEISALAPFGERHLRALIDAISGIGFDASDTFFMCAPLYEQIDESV
jgi:hypothetical protein